jgi:hypothetical protein
VPLEERLAVVQSYFSYGKVQWEEKVGGTQTSLLRFCYVDTASFVVSLRDRGYAGDTLRYALIVFVPRIVWPGKPVISVFGEELYTAMSGQTGTSVTPGSFAEVYWDLGWFGMPLPLIPYGILLGILSRISLVVMERDQWIFLPAILNALPIGYSVDGWYVMNVLGGGSTTLLFYAALWGLDRFLSGTNRAKAFTPGRRWQGNVNSPAQALWRHPNKRPPLQQG